MRARRVSREHEDELSSQTSISPRARARTRRDPGTSAGERLHGDAEATAAAHGGAASEALTAMQGRCGNRVVQRLIRHAPAEPAATDGAWGATRSGLPDALRAGIERLSGESMADVRVHFNSSRPAQLGALAFAEGSEIHMGPGSERHLPHEAWHVVQQKQGRVRPTTLTGGHLVNDDPSLEREAHRMGDRASSRPSHAPGPGRERGHGEGAGRRGRSVVQMLSLAREPRDGVQVKLDTQSRGREWKLALFDEDGKGSETCSILFKLVTSFIGKKPKLSIDSMQARSSTKGTGTALLKHIPWAVSEIVKANPLATRFGSVTLHSGFANIIAFQMAVKGYAQALDLRGTTLWEEYRAEAAAALPVVEVDETETVPSKDETESTTKKRRPAAYDLGKFPELWADTKALIAIDLFDIEASRMDLSDAKRTVKMLGGRGLFDNFGASIDVKSLADLNAKVEEVKREAAARLASV